VDTTKQLNTISFFKGYGGIERGIELTGERIKPIASCEIEAYAIANLVAKMEEGALDTHPIWTNAKTFPGEQFLGKVDLFTGGFPCQPFSAAGGRKADEDPRHLWPACIRAIDQFRPQRVLFENVEGLISAKLGGDGWSDPKGTPVLLHVCRELERRGYKTTWGVFSASEAGAPHQRKRVFILGQLANTNSSNAQEGGEFGVPSKRIGARESDGIDKRSTITRSEELAHSETMQCNGSEDNTRELIEPRSISESRNNGRERSFQWPTRPGEPQGRMEEPRTQPKLGGAVDGASFVSDRLRELSYFLSKKGVTYEELLDLWETNNRKESLVKKVLQLYLLWQITDGEESKQGYFKKEIIKAFRKERVRELWGDEPVANTSRELRRELQGGDSLPNLSHRSTQERWDLGEGEQESKELCDLQKTIYPKQADCENLLKRMLERIREDERSKTMGNTRIDRLRLLGNGVVPQTAAIAWTVLNERLNQSTQGEQNES
jgi:DNA-cytosine methyltransferase